MLRKHGSFTASYLSRLQIHVLVKSTATRVPVRLFMRRDTRARLHSYTIGDDDDDDIVATLREIKKKDANARAKRNNVAEYRLSNENVAFAASSSNNELIDISLARSNVVVVIFIVRVRLCAPGSAEIFASSSSSSSLSSLLGRRRSEEQRG